MNVQTLHAIMEILVKYGPNLIVRPLQKYPDETYLTFIYDFGDTGAIIETILKQDRQDLEKLGVDVDNLEVYLGG